jgi:hypothetical protein
MYWARGSSPKEEQNWNKTSQQPYRQLCRNAAVLGAGGQTGTEAWRRQRPTLNNQATGKMLGLQSLLTFNKPACALGFIDTAGAAG